MQISPARVEPVKAKLSIERRTSPRVLIEWAVSYRRIQASEINHGSKEVGQVIQAWCRDVSKGGMCLASPAPLAKNDLLALNFEIEEPPRTVELFAKAAWVEPHGHDFWRAGICFLSGDDADAEYVVNYFTELFGRGYEPI